MANWEGLQGLCLFSDGCGQHPSLHGVRLLSHWEVPLLLPATEQSGQCLSGLHPSGSIPSNDSLTNIPRHVEWQREMLLYTLVKRAITS